MKAAALALILVATAASAQVEDAEHRADRQRTEQLNRDAARAVAERDRGQDRASARYRAEREEYRRAFDDWRRRVAECQMGNVRDCDLR